jgi:site-specific DNA recombinase
MVAFMQGNTLFIIVDLILAHNIKSIHTQDERRQRRHELSSAGEAKKLVAILAKQPEGENRSVVDRLAELDQRAGQNEVRIAEIQKALVEMSSRPIDRTDVAHALSLFTPVWDGLKPREQARVLHLLIDHIDYDGESNEVAITFHAAGIEALAQEVAAAGEPPPDETGRGGRAP